MNTRNIKTRLTFWYAGILTLALVVFSFAVWILLDRKVHADLVSSVLNQSEGLKTYLIIEDSDPSVRLAHEIDEYSRSLPQKHLLSVFKSAGAKIYSNQNAGEIALANQQAAAPFELTSGGERYIAVLRPVMLREGRFETLLAIPETPSVNTVRSLAVILACLVPLFVATGVLGGYLLSKKALQPVAEITERARMIGVHDLSARLPVLHTQDELQQLTETWNGMLDRIEQAVTRIKQFTADASHELRTPVAVIRLAAESALRRERPGEEYRDALARIQSESEEMTRLIEDLLFLARADSKSGESFLELVALAPVVEDACRAFSPLAEAKQIDVNVDVPAGVPLLLGNVSAVHRVLRILLENAIKYTPPRGSIRIDVVLQEHNVVLRVTDSGVGVPDELRERIFERFFRVDSSRNREAGGNGLGLAIARAILSQYDASIAVTSSSEGGSMFSVSWPVAA